MEDDGWSGLLGLNLTPSDNQLWYTLVSRGYKAHAIDNSSNAFFYRAPFGPDGQTITTEDAVLNPETLLNWELGFKQDFGGKGFVHANLFISDVTDFQSASFDGNTSSFRFINAGSIRSRGIELAIQWAMTNNTRIQLAGSYIDAYYSDFTNAPCQVGQIAEGTCSTETGGQDLTCIPVNETPPFQWLIGLQQYFDVYQGQLLGKLDFQYQDSFLFDVDQDENTRQEAYGLLDLSLNYQHHSGIDAGIYINNLTDQRYAHRIIDAPLYPGAYQAYPGDGRHYGLSIRVLY